MRRQKRFFPVSIYSVGFYVAMMVLFITSHAPKEITVTFGTVGLIVTGAVVMWCAKARSSTGNEWWQDDNASGWRGY